MTGKFVFATDSLPLELGERQRQSSWRDFFAQTAYPADISFLPDRPTSVRFEYLPLRATAVFQYQGTISQLKGATRAAAANAPPVFHFGFNAGAPSFFYETRADITEMPSQALMLVDSEQPNISRSNGANSWQGLQIPKQKLLQQLPRAEDSAYLTLPETEAGRFFRRYLEMVCRNIDLAGSPALAAHVETTLLDLVVLAIGSRSDEMAVARMRGLRTARTHAILQEIRSGFLNPGFSSLHVARKLGLSPRYVNELLHETAAGFAERVLELRLQKVRTALVDRANDHMRISDIALASGFSDISYFNRSFRRRFGASPTQYRGERPVR